MNILVISVSIVATLVAAAVIPEENVPVDTSHSPTTVPTTHINHRTCETTTPCGWTIYETKNMMMTFLRNDYCICASDKECSAVEDDPASGAFVHRCTNITIPDDNVDKNNTDTNNTSDNDTSVENVPSS